MDVMMPIMDGVHATKLIRRINKDVIIIGMTANDDICDHKEYLESGMNCVVCKPLNFDILYSKIKQYGKYVGKITKNHLNYNMLDSVTSRDNDMKTYLINEIKKFCQECLIKLDYALNTEDHNEIKIISHSLKGSAAQVGAEYISKISSKLEIAAENSNYEDENKYIDKLKHAINIFNEMT